MPTPAVKHFTPDIASHRGAGLTREVADFVVQTDYASIPEDVTALASKSILDGLGLALSGSVAESGGIVQRYLQAQGFGGDATVIGTGQRVQARFAAFANGVAVHADDYDDTQLDC